MMMPDPETCQKDDPHHVYSLFDPAVNGSRSPVNHCAEHPRGKGSDDQGHP